MKIMIVDDEAIVRIGFKSLVDWQALGCEISEASNGQEAFEKCRKEPPDVLVTDIRMPVMDGLELLKRLQAEHPEIISFILSAFDDFPYVKQAFRLGITDYILKAEMDEAVLMDLFERAKQLLSSSVRAPTPRQQSDDKPGAFFSRHLFSEGGNPQTLPQEAAEAGIRIQGKRTACLLLRVQRFNEILERYGEGSLSRYQLSMQNCITESLSELDRVWFYPISLQKYFILIRIADSIASPAAWLFQLGRAIQKQIRDFLNIRMDIGIAYCPSADVTALRKQYENAGLAADASFFQEEASPVLYTRALFAADSSFFHPAELCDQFQRLLYWVINNGGPVDIEPVLFPPDKGSPHEKGEILRLYTRYFYLLSTQIPHAEELPEIKKTLGEFGRALAAEEPLPLLNRLLSDIFTKLAALSAKGSNYLVDKAKAYIRQHFSEAISLSMVADKLSVSEEHLSRLFTETTGDSFSHFLTGVRVDYAKELLRSGQYRIYEISEMVGYSSTEHFSRVFKGRVGVTPKQYMNQLTP